MVGVVDNVSMRVSVELIPRNEKELLRDAGAVRSVMPAVSAFNIPDLMQFPLRSWEACRLTSALLPASIPHIRAIDIPPDGEVPLVETIQAAGLSEVLVIRGDPPRDLGHRTYPNSSEEIIHRIKSRCPGLRVYAGFDPYRSGFQDELTAVRRKLDAGADGFFTQPLFDVRLLEICSDMLAGQDIFWGIAPIIGERSQAYWETTNRVVLPKDFEPTLGWNRHFAVRAVDAVRRLGGNVYFMPIRVNLTAYLSNLLPD